MVHPRLVFHRSRRGLASGCVALLVTLAACSRSGPSTDAPAPKRPLILSVLSTNDVHGHIEHLPMFAGYVDNLRRARSRDGAVLLLDAGDAFHGTLASDLDEGRTIIRAYNEMGYAALALGNHEFDFGPAGPASFATTASEDPQGALRQRIAEARFPVLSANLVRSDGRKTDWQNLTPSALATIGTVRVGLVGVITEEAPEVIKRPNFAGLRVTSPVVSVLHEAKALRSQGAEVVVVVAHAGAECESADLNRCDPDSEIFELARSLPPGLVDMIAAGHRNATIATEVANTPIVHVDSGLSAFSRVDLVLDPETHAVTAKRVFRPREICGLPESVSCASDVYEGLPVKADGRIAAAIQPALDEAARAHDVPLGVRVHRTLTADKDHECALGNLFADLMREAVPGADAAMTNGGSLRHDLPPGDLTYGELHEAMPFDNRIARLHLTGAQLKRLLAANVTEEHGILSISGIRARVACEQDSIIVHLARADGTPVGDDDRLTVVTNDFLAMGGDGLLRAVRVDPSAVDVDKSTSVRDALVAGLQKKRDGLSGDDPTLFDPSRPRIELPGTLPLRCETGGAAAPFLIREP